MLTQRRQRQRQQAARGRRGCKATPKGEGGHVTVDADQPQWPRRRGLSPSYILNRAARGTAKNFGTCPVAPRPSATGRCSRKCLHRYHGRTVQDAVEDAAQDAVSGAVEDAIEDAIGEVAKFFGVLDTLEL